MCEAKTADPKKKVRTRKSSRCFIVRFRRKIVVKGFGFPPALLPCPYARNSPAHEYTRFVAKRIGQTPLATVPRHHDDPTQKAPVSIGGATHRFGRDVLS